MASAYVAKGPRPGVWLLAGSAAIALGVPVGPNTAVGLPVLDAHYHDSFCLDHGGTLTGHDDLGELRVRVLPSGTASVHGLVHRGAPAATPATAATARTAAGGTPARPGSCYLGGLPGTPRAGTGDTCLSRGTHLTSPSTPQPYRDNGRG